MSGAHSGGDDRSSHIPAASQILASLVAERPRLMATPAATARMRAVLRTHRLAAEWFEKIRGHADEMLAKPLLGSTDTLDTAREFVSRIETLGVVWFAAGGERYRDRARQELLAMCALPDWQGDEFLVTAETMFGAAIGHDWLYDALSDAERRAVADAIIAKGLQPGLAEFAHDDSPSHWTTARTNWNLVGNGALMIAAMSVADTDPATARHIFDLCRRSVPIGFSQYAPDGGWVEGPGYWHYATEYAVYLIDCLTTALGDDLGLGGSPGFGNTGLFRLHAGGPSGKLFNFADSEETHSGGYWLLWLARRYHHPVDAWLERHQHKVHPMDLLWFDPDIRSVASDGLPPHHVFRAIGVAMLRGDWSAGTTYLGIKGGDNAASHHAHYDLGSFVLDAGGLRWAIDLGPDDYHLPDYFDPAARLRYYRTNTLGHNTMVIGGESQAPTARAPLAGAAFEPGLPRITLDMTAAYPGCASARRGFALIAGRDVLIVDEIVPAAPLSSVVWQMHTTAAATPQGDAAVLAQTASGGTTARLFLRILAPAGAAFAVADATPTGPSGQNANQGCRKLTIRLGPIEAPLRVAVLLSPDEAAAAAPHLPEILAGPLDGWGEPRRG